MSRKPKEAEADEREPPKKIYTIDEIKIAAYNWKEFPPDDLDVPERILWLSLANVYKRFRDKEITKEEGEKLKGNIVANYQRDKAQFDMQKAIVQAQADMWSRIEVSSHRYGTERTIEAADAFFEAVYNVKLKPIAENNRKDDSPE